MTEEEQKKIEILIQRKKELQHFYHELNDLYDKYKGSQMFNENDFLRDRLLTLRNNVYGMHQKILHKIADLENPI